MAALFHGDVHCCFIPRPVWPVWFLARLVLVAGQGAGLQHFLWRSCTQLNYTKVRNVVRFAANGHAATCPHITTKLLYNYAHHVERPSEGVFLERRVHLSGQNSRAILPIVQKDHQSNDLSIKKCPFIRTRRTLILAKHAEGSSKGCLLNALGWAHQDKTHAIFAPRVHAWRKTENQGL